MPCFQIIITPLTQVSFVNAINEKIQSTIPHKNDANHTQNSATQKKRSLARREARGPSQLDLNETA